MTKTLSDFPPTYVQVEGKKYWLKTSFRSALLALDIVKDGVLSDYEKTDLVIGGLVKNPFARFMPAEKKISLYRSIASDFLSHGQNKKTSSKKVMDLVQDKSLIIAAFRQSYGIDLCSRSLDLHWWTFLDLLAGIPADTRLMEIVSIRSRPLPKPTKYNHEERAQLMRLKSEYALKLSDEEKQAQMQDGLRRMAASLQAIAKKKGGEIDS